MQKKGSLRAAFFVVCEKLENLPAGADGGSEFIREEADTIDTSLSPGAELSRMNSLPHLLPLRSFLCLLFL
jgi:hypothetical protein